MEKKTNKSIHKTGHARVHHHRKNTKTKKFKPNLAYALLGAAALIIIVVLITNFTPKSTISKPSISKPTETPVNAAIVNGKEISISEIEDQWAMLPDDYKAKVSKDIILTQTIEKELLLQDAESKGITVSTERAKAFLDDLLSKSGFSQDYLENQLSSKGITMDDIIEMYREQLIVVDLVNKTIFPLIEVSEEEITEFYDSNKENINGTLNESRDQIIMLLKMGKQSGAIKNYVKNLKSDSDIQILYDFNKTEVNREPVETVPPSSITTFTKTGDPQCTEGGKPTVYLFSTTWCPHCNWVGDTFNRVVLEYVNKGLISAHHWEIDTGDDTLTTEVETEVPAQDMDIYKKYNPRGSIPTFVFGCEYSRIGNGFESTGDLSLEEGEFRAVLDKITQ